MPQAETAAPVDSAEVVTLADEQAVVDVVSSSILKLWGAINDLTRLRPTRRERRRMELMFHVVIRTPRL